MIPAFNCRELLRESLASVLQQAEDAESMQIEIVDDASEDDPASLLSEIAPGRVSYFRQARNVGLVRNLNTCVTRAQGDLVHILHADDLVLPGFYAALDELFRNHPSAGAAFSRVRYRDMRNGEETIGPLVRETSGIMADALDVLLRRHPVATSASVVRAEVYRSIGPFDPRFRCCAEDKEMWARIATHWPIAFETRDLAVYRFMREGSSTQRNLASGRYSRDIVRAHRIMETYIPSRYGGALAAARRYSAAWLTRNVVGRFLAEGDLAAAARNAAAVLACDTSPATRLGIYRLFIRARSDRGRCQGVGPGPIRETP